MACGGYIAWRLNRDLRREVGAAVGHIQSSSAELEAAAAQQASGGRDQASAMNEITTTISELLITSRQIADSAQRVSKIAEETAEAARTGDATVEQTRTSIAAIRTQVDQIVQHMLALGEKSQQIGGVADLVSELAEQTNILAINATIEAAGAGEAGRRFAVVADEIRKLADRVTGSTKEIRALVDDVRGAVNATVMTTETGSKAVDAGARQFSEVASTFDQIGGRVATAADAAKEIELSTKQQATAVEQVTIAVTNVAQATRESEASTEQTLQTAAELAGLSRDLLRIIQPQASA
jgi:methyl-accepting chemotaxis protein